MNFPGLVLFIVLLVAVELTVFSWACHEKPKNKDDDLSANDRSQQEGHGRMIPLATPPHIENGDKCIARFSVNGLKPNFPAGNTVPICQNVPESLTVEDAKFATLFDTSLGIPRYSIYSVDPDQAKKIIRQDKWHQTAGIKLQGSSQLYKNQLDETKYQKGHVAPFNILSYSKESGLASFAFTNAVPQVNKFNIGSWKTYEGRIVKYAKEQCGSDHVGGTLYLITGISEAYFQAVGAKVNVVKQPMLRFKKSIAIPNSMWTVGCCVQPGQVVFGAFAGIGNNELPDPEVLAPMLTNLGVEKVEQIIGVGANDQNIKLFPGNPGCYDPTKQVDLPA